MNAVSEYTGKAVSFLKKYRYPALILLLGIALLLWKPGARKTNRAAEQGQTTIPAETETGPFLSSDYCEELEAELEDILSQIAGAGNVRVMLTLRSGQTTVYQTDEDRKTENNGEQSTATVRTETVILSAGSSYNKAAVVRQEYPVIQGALIVCDGADDPTVCYQLAVAASTVLGIGTDKITVVKMKTSLGE